MNLSRVAASVALLLALFLTTGCIMLASAPVAVPASPTPFLPPDRPTATPAPPSNTPTRRPTLTDIPSVTLMPSLTHFPTSMPAPTRPSSVYVFPVQPSKAASYQQGVKGHGYPATDIFAPPGTKFVAVINGMVDFVSANDRWEPGQPDPSLRSGLAVAIIGIDGFRYYGSHLSALAPGLQPGHTVIAGQVLGYVGSSGDARGTDPHLHFGISRPTFPDDWQVRRGEIDPFPFLNAWQAGVDLTPFFP
jgi:murein DD-endopeptidase MepM/ murein hydrolase activator NlpD